MGHKEFLNGFVHILNEVDNCIHNQYQNKMKIKIKNPLLSLFMKVIKLKLLKSILYLLKKRENKTKVDFALKQSITNTTRLSRIEHINSMRLLRLEHKISHVIMSQTVYFKRHIV